MGRPPRASQRVKRRSQSSCLASLRCKTTRRHGWVDYPHTPAPPPFPPFTHAFLPASSSQALLAQVVQATKSANALPTEGDEFEFYSSFPGFKTFCSKIGLRINKRYLLWCYVNCEMRREKEDGMYTD